MYKQSEAAMVCIQRGANRTSVTPELLCCLNQKEEKWRTTFGEVHTKTPKPVLRTDHSIVYRPVFTHTPNAHSNGFELSRYIKLSPSLAIQQHHN